MNRAATRSGLKAEIHGSLAAVEALWRGIEGNAAVFATPYQRFDWVAAFVAETDATRGAAGLRIIVLRDEAGRVRMILPLLCKRERGAMVARVVGGTHANFHMPLFASREAAAASAEAVVEALRAAGAQGRIDAYVLSHQPRFWDGAVNPLGIGGEAAASDAYGLQLGPDPEATVKRVFSADARKKLRAKERKLAEAFGPVAFRVAASSDDIATYLAAFYRHKASRFAALGLPDPYASDAVRRSIAEAASPERGAVEVCALVGIDDGRVYATFAGAVDPVRYSGMMTAFDQDPAVARFSPGDILLQHLVRHQAAQGRRAFDLGIGEARYKASICDETIALRELSIPVTLRGRFVVAEALCRTRIKGWIKRRPGLFRLVRALLRRRPNAGDRTP